MIEMARPTSTMGVGSTLEILMPTERSRAAIAAPLLLLLAPCGLAQEPWFLAPLLQDTSHGRFELLGDVDQDGDPDVIAVGTANGALQFTVMENDGSGHLTAGQAITLPGGSAGQYLLLTDLDGDLDPDLIVSTQSTSLYGAGLAVFPGLPGPAFGALTHVVLPGNVVGLASGHANGDAITDLFVTHGNGLGPIPSRWIFGGAGMQVTFGPLQVLPATFDITTLDVDGDGLDDIAMALGGSLNPGTLRLFATTANGFDALPSVPLLPGSVQQSVAIDCDQDGDEDLVVASASGSTFYLTTLTNDGTGTWPQASQAYPSVSFGKLFQGDWNGDGLPDLLQRSSSSGAYHEFMPFANTGLGTWTLAYYQSIRSDTPYVTGAGLGDLDGDGNLDFVDADALVFGDGTMNFPFAGPATYAPVDWDRDGDLDALSDTTLQTNDGRGIFAAATLIVAQTPTNRSYDTAVLTTDLEGDGLHERIALLREFVFPFGWQSLGLRLLREQGDGTLLDAGPAALPTVGMTSAIADDCDGDGDLDIVDRQGAWFNDGAGFFTLTVPATGSYQPFAKGDVDGDGDQDLLAATQDGGTSLAILRRTGPGTYATEVLYPGASSTITNTPGLLADLDDDGDLDVAGKQVTATGIATTVVFANQGGTFVLAATLPHSGRLSAGDVDGDGLLDLAIGEPGRLHVLRRTGPGMAFAPAVSFATPEVGDLADLDQDGDLDGCGQAVVRGRRFVAPQSGFRRQYGSGTPGTGSRRPILSVTGAIRPGLTPAIRLANAPGGTAAILMVGSAPNDAPSVILPGVHSYVAGLDLLLGYTLGGAPGLAGAGAIDVPVAIPASAAGLDLYLEFLVFDGAVPGFLTNSNGCAMHVGQ